MKILGYLANKISLQIIFCLSPPAGGRVKIFVGNFKAKLKFSSLAVLAPPFRKGGKSNLQTIHFFA
jgi:hypothetical protein